MLDLNFVTENAELVKENAQRKGADCDIDKVVSLNKKRKEVIQQHENLVADLKKIEKALGPAMSLISKGFNAATSEKIAKAVESIPPMAFLEDAKKLVTAAISLGDYKNKMRESRKLADSFKASLRVIESQIQDELFMVPNLLSPEVPNGSSEDDNQILYEQNTRVYEPFIEEHLEYASKRGLLDMSRGAKLCGSSFPLLMGDLARLERALMCFCLDNNRRKGYVEVSPPLMNNKDTVFSTGYWPKMAEQMYCTDPERFYLIPTTEAPLTGMHAGEILSAEMLPLKYTACTPCWRREAAAGHDQHGLLRVHQFMKTEMFILCRPQDSEQLHEQLRKDIEDILKKLKLHYRVLELCAGDVSFSAARCWDLECYAPGHGSWLEVSSISNFKDFQTRRAEIKYRETSGKKAKFCHTLNGSGLAAPRVLAAILEQCQNKKGEVVVPKVLRPYMGMQESILKGGGTVLKSLFDLIVN